MSSDSSVDDILEKQLESEARREALMARIAESREKRATYERRLEKAPKGGSDGPEPPFEPDEFTKNIGLISSLDTASIASVNEHLLYLWWVNGHKRGERLAATVAHVKLHPPPEQLDLVAQVNMIGKFVGLGKELGIEMGRDQSAAEFLKLVLDKLDEQSRGQPANRAAPTGSQDRKREDPTASDIEEVRRLAANELTEVLNSVNHAVDEGLKLKKLPPSRDGVRIACALDAEGEAKISFLLQNEAPVEGRYEAVLTYGEFCWRIQRLKEEVLKGNRDASLERVTYSTVREMMLANE